MVEIIKNSDQYVPNMLDCLFYGFKMLELKMTKKL